MSCQQPISNKERNSEMKQLNALERKFRLEMLSKNGYVSTSNMRKTSVSKHVVPELRSPADDEEMSSFHDEEYIGENKINFKIEKKLSEKNFIFDLHSKKDHLVQILNYLLMCNEGSSVLYF